MYDKILKEIEEYISTGTITAEALAKHLDNIIKIKTIQALDTSAELIAESRRVSRN